MTVHAATDEALKNLWEQFKSDDLPKHSGNGGYSGRLDVPSYLSKYGFEIVKTKPHGGSTLYCLMECLFNPDHKNNEAAIGQTADGKLFYQCFHDSCKGKRTWHDARQKISGSDRIGEGSERTRPDQRPLDNQDISAALSNDIIDVEDFQKIKLPKRPVILDPWLKQSTLAMIYAGRGVGKTWLATILALAIRSGGAIGPWRVKNPAGCLYIDAEMAAEDMQQDRIALLLGCMPPAVAPLKILSADLMHRNGRPQLNLTNDVCRNAIYDYLVANDNIKVMFLDNIAALTPGYDENSKEVWDPVNQWLLRLRFLGVAVVLIHHAGKNGNQRGTSGREDSLDVVIKLERPAGYRMSEGARFTIKFEKARSVAGSVVEDLCLSIEQDEQGNLVYATLGADTGDARTQIVCALAAGVPVKDICSMLGCTKQNVSYHKAWAIKRGYLDGKGKFTEVGEKMYGQTI